jgi:hypothetical protein
MKHMSTKALPILQRSHWPQIGPRRCSRAEHAELVKQYPENYVTDPSALPYAVFIQEDGAQFLTDHQYRPLWWRAAECAVARRCDPKEWFDWCGVYWLYDNDLLPSETDQEPEWVGIFRESDKQPYQLRKMLKLVLQEFCNGGSLWVRRWKPEHIQGGVLVARSYVRHGMRVIENCE